MFGARIPVRRKHLEFSLSTAGLFLAVLAGISIVGLAGAGSKAGQQYTIFDAPDATYTSAVNINDPGTLTGNFFRRKPPDSRFSARCGQRDHRHRRYA